MRNCAPKYHSVDDSCQAIFFSGESDSVSAIWLVGGEKWAGNNRNALFAPITDLVVLDERNKISHNLGKAAIFTAAPCAWAKKPRSSKYPSVGIKKVRYAVASIILYRAL